MFQFLPGAWFISGRAMFFKDKLPTAVGCFYASGHNPPLSFVGKVGGEGVTPRRREGGVKQKNSSNMIDSPTPPEKKKNRT